MIRLGFWLAPLALLASCGSEAAPPAISPNAPPAPTAPPAALTTAPVAKDGPPVAPVRPVTDTYFGTAVVDPYRWMEDEKSTELAPWMKAQADYTRAQIDALPLRAALLTRIKQLDHSGDRVGGAQVRGGRWFYMKREQAHDLPKFCVRDSLSAPERVLVDPESLQTGGKHFAIDWTSPSLDGKLVAYGISESGSEASVLHVIDAATGKELTDTWDRMQFGGTSWLDAKHFFYTRLQKMADGAPITDKYKRATAYLHELGRDPDKDPPVFGANVVDSIPVKDAEFGIASAPMKQKWIFAMQQDGVRNERTVYFAPRASLAGAKTPWKKLVDLSDEVTDFAVRGDDFFYVTHKDALRFKVMKTSLAKPNLATATVVIPESEAVIESIGAADDALYVHVLDAGIGRLRRLGYAPTAKVGTVTLPVEGTLADMYTSPDRDGALFGLLGWTTSFRIYAYDSKTNKVDDTKLAPPSPVDFSNVASEEVRVKSADGTMVPMSIIHAKDFAKDSSHPTWLTGYGAYGITMNPYFQPVRLAWIEHNGEFAYCHARGGGDLGEGWHQDGMLLKKQHTIDDMIACGQWLVDNKYTQSAKLAGEGTSAGGITIGGAITQRPDLFAAALIRVGVSNALRFEHTVNVMNVPEFGSAATEDGFKGLYAMDAYSHVKDGERYPAVMVTTGATDPRVAPWQATKMAARLQAATSSGKPVLLRVDYDAGHGMGSTASQRDEETADEEAFLLAQFGENEK